MRGPSLSWTVEARSPLSGLRAKTFRRNPAQALGLAHSYERRGYTMVRVTGPDGRVIYDPERQVA